MQEFKKRRNPRVELLRFGFTILALVVIGVITFFAVRGAWNMYHKFSEASLSNEGAQQELQNLKARQVTISSTVEQLNTARGEEAQIRQRYGVARPGEGQIQIIRDTNASSTTPSVPQNWFGRLIQALFGWL